MYRFLYNNYTFWIKKNLKGLQGIQGPTQPSPPTNFSFISDHSPTPVPLAFYYPWNVPSISLPQAFCTCLPFCLGSSSSKYPIPPLEFYWKVPCSAKFTLTTLIKFINSPPIRAYPPYLLHLPHHRAYYIFIYCQSPSLNLGECEKGDSICYFHCCVFSTWNNAWCTQCKYCWMNEWVNKWTNT